MQNFGGAERLVGFEDENEDEDDRMGDGDRRDACPTVAALEFSHDNPRPTPPPGR